MKYEHNFFSRLLPAALATSGFAASAHTVLIAFASRSVGFELAYIFTLSFFVAFIIAMIGGAILLWIVKTLKLGLISSFLPFLISVQLVTIGLEMTFFEIGFEAVSWQYLWISIPAAIIA